MNKCKTMSLLFVLLLCSASVYASYTIVDQLKSLRATLQELVLVLAGDETLEPLKEKLQIFFTKIGAQGKPLAVIYALFDEANLVPSISKSELPLQDLTPVEKQAQKSILAEFSDLLQEVDQSSNPEILRSFVNSHLEELLKRFSQKLPLLETQIKNKKIQDKISALLQAIDQSPYALQIYRKILESLRELPILPKKEEELVYTPEELQREKDLMARHASLMKEIMKEKNILGTRKSYVNQLNNAYRNVKRSWQEGYEGNEPPPVPKRELPEGSEEERPLPPLPGVEPEKPQKEEHEGTIPPPPPSPEKKEPGAPQAPEKS